MGAPINEWTDVVVAVAAIAAVVISLVSLGVSWRALRLSEKQERRKDPRLVPHLLDSCFEGLAGGGRVYSFWLSVRNPTDADNAIAQIEMHLSYLIDGPTSITVKLPSSAATAAANDGRPRLAAPTRIAAHDTVSGWCDFVVMPGLLSGHDIDGYRIVLTDSHQLEATVDALVVSEKRHAG